MYILILRLLIPRQGKEDRYLDRIPDYRPKEVGGRTSSQNRQSQVSCFVSYGP